MASSNIVASADGLWLVPMLAPATPRKSAATWGEAMCLTRRLLLLPRRTQNKLNAIMPRLSPLSRLIQRSSPYCTQQQIVHEHCCGLDVDKKSAVACVFSGQEQEGGPMLIQLTVNE